MSRLLTLLLCGYLIGWVPFRFADVLLTALSSIEMRGLPALLELAGLGLISVLCASAGWMVLIRAPAAGPFAIAAVLASSTAVLQSLFWTALPSQTAPGERLPLGVLAVAHAVFWVSMVRRGRVAAE